MIFAVFDGHGGKEVAILASKHFVDILIITDQFINKEYKTALEQSFIILDNKLKTEYYQHN